MCAQYKAKDPMFLSADSKDLDQPGCTVHFVDFVMLRYYCLLILYLTSLQLVLCRVAAVKRLPVHQP